MGALSIILPIILLVSLILDYLYSVAKENAFEIVRKMGMGYNIANTFDSFIYFGKLETPDEQIGLNGNIAPTKDMIKKLKKYGFKTIRFPVTWMYFIDDEGNISPEWMARVKEVIDIIINEKLYCILNVHSDGLYIGWISGLESKDKYINLWKQIANEFKDYNEYLIFESMDYAYFIDYDFYEFDYKTLLILNQAFVDTIRKSGGYNTERLLIIAGANVDLEMTCSSKYKIPVDQSNKLAISIHYFSPYNFIYDYYYEPYNWTDIENITYMSGPKLNWGNSLEYNDFFKDLELMITNFIDKGIPIIISEVGVLTKQNKELESIREYLYILFSVTSNMDGIICCLWDTSNEYFGDMNFYDRTNDIWYDEKLKNNFIQISKGKSINPMKFFINTNFESTDIIMNYDSFLMNIEKRKVLKIFINVKLTGVLFEDVEFPIQTNNKNGDVIEIYYGKNNVKKQYDGTSIITIDVSRKECYDFVEATIISGMKYITLNNMTLEFEKSFMSIDYKSLKNAISNYVK